MLFLQIILGINVALSLVNATFNFSGKNVQAGLGWGASCANSLTALILTFT
jgi:hypothetical protein